MKKDQSPRSCSFYITANKKEGKAVSSLVVSAPKISKHNGFMGKRTEIGTREAAALRGCNFILEELIETEETHGENNLDSSTAEPSKKHRLNEDTENSMDLTEGKVDQDGTVKKLNLASEAETLSEGGETTLSTSPPILPAEKQREQGTKHPVTDSDILVGTAVQGNAATPVSIWESDSLPSNVSNLLLLPEDRHMFENWSVADMEQTTNSIALWLVRAASLALSSKNLIPK